MRAASWQEGVCWAALCGRSRRCDAVGTQHGNKGTGPETTVSNDSSDQGMGTRQRLARANAGEGRLDCVDKRHRGESPISAEVPTKELQL